MTEHGGHPDQTDPELRDLPVAEAPAGPNRRVRWWFGALAVLAVTALVVALAVRAGDDTSTASGDGELRPLPLAGGIARLEASAMYGPEPRYTLGAELPDLGATAPVHELRAPELTSADVERMASGLGLTGAAERDPSGWSVVDGDRGLYLAGTGAGWSISYAATGPMASEGWSGCAAVDPATGGAAPDCVPPTTHPVPAPAPVDLPSEGEAERIARDLLTRLGLLDGEWQSRVSSGIASVGVAVGCPAGADCPAPPPQPAPQSRDVTFTRVVDGTPVEGLGLYVGLGDGGAVVDLGGAFADVVAVGDYPLASTTAAYQAMVDGTALDAGWSSLAMDQGVTGTTAMAASDLTVAPYDGDVPQPDAPVADDVAPPSTLAPGEPYEVEVTGVELGYSAVGSSSGRVAYVVPVYRFTGTATYGTWERTVVALDPAWIEAADPQPVPVPEPIPPEPVPLPEPEPMPTTVETTAPGRVPATEPAVVTTWRQP